MYPLDDENKKISDLTGWYSTCVMTSASSSILGGLRSTMLNASKLFSRLHKLILRSSADKKFSPSGDKLSELIL